MFDDTTVINVTTETDEETIKSVLRDVLESLEERGYNPVNQLVGYLMSGDLGYISSYKDARNKISEIDRSIIIESLLKNYLR